MPTYVLLNNAARIVSQQELPVRERFVPEHLFGARQLLLEVEVGSDGLQERDREPSVSEEGVGVKHAKARVKCRPPLRLISQATRAPYA